MESKLLKTRALNTVCLLVAAIVGAGAGGCASTGIYHNVPPAYDLPANQDKKVLIWIETPRSAAADPDAPEKLAQALRNYLIAKANIKPDNVLVAHEIGNVTADMLITPETAALQAGAGLALFVRIEEYELLPMNIRNYHSGRLLTRTILLDAQTAQPLWPSDTLGKQHDIVVELGQGNRNEILSRLNNSTAHCIVRHLYPIKKIYYKNSDERISIQEAYELETF